MDLLKRNSEYIPVYSLDWVANGLFRDILHRQYSEVCLIDADSVLADIPIHSLIKEVYTQKQVDKDQFLYSISEFLDRVINKDYSTQSVVGDWRTSYITVREALKPDNVLSFNGGERVYTRSYGTLYTGRGTIAEIVYRGGRGTVLEPIVMIVVKREYLSYLATCLLLGEKPLSSIFEFWISDTTRFNREKYQKYIKPIVNRITKLGVPVVYKGGVNLLDGLVPSIVKPPVKTLKDYKNWLTESANLLYHEYTDPEADIITKYSEIRKEVEKKHIEFNIGTVPYETLTKEKLKQFIDELSDGLTSSYTIYG